MSKSVKVGLGVFIAINLALVLWWLLETTGGPVH
jgi:hypothetical protein